MTHPTQAEIVIIGGGIIGCSTAYHLAKEGAKDVVLLEGGKLTNGSTWHAAGLVGQLRSSANITQLLKNSVEIYKNLEKETGLATGWKMNGGLRLACNKDRWIEVKRQATTAHSFGLPMELLTPQEAQDLWPLMDVSDVVGAAFLPTDGQANPSDITQSLAKGARMRGVKIYEDTKVIDVEVTDGVVTGVVTEHGTIKCEKVVNCCGQWAKEVGRMAGVNVPLQPVEHQYMVTEPLTTHSVPGDLPTLRDPDRLIYFKEEVGGLVMGGYEPNPIAWARNGIPKNFYFSLLNENWEHFEQLMEQALIRVPALETAGIKTLTNGPESFTPDGNFILGEAPEVKNFFVGAGFNAFGIASGGGAGKALAEWVLAGEPPMDLWPVDIRRFSQVYRNDKFVCDRTLEAYSKHYTMSWPHEEYKSGRPMLTSLLYDVLKEQGACFGSKSGWERPNWFAPEGTIAEDVYSYGRQNWFDAVGEEHKAARDSVVVFDQSSFAKFILKGKDAVSALSWICANDVDKPVGSLIYTQMLNDNGGIECDLTVGRIAEDAYYIVTGTGFRTHDYAWIEANIPDGMDATLEDITEGWTTLSLMGPNARNVLEKITPADVSNDEFPFGTVQHIDIAGHSVRALRVTFVGELGWELHMPHEAGMDVYCALMEAGKPFSIRNAGYRAIESLRLEKGYRVWSSDLTPDNTPQEAGLGWAVKLKGDTAFKGRAALEVRSGSPLTKRLACFTVADPNVVLLGRETIYRNGERVGYLSSGGWGYTVEKNIGYGYVRHPEGVSTDYLKEGTYELEVACERVPCEIHLGALYDPKMEKVKA
ncbi:FAD-dependent oxidoreductase [Parasalinivibrio latis]|uniref:GcvT family protein n=1 Tax=Parasalinivibrio latis TaxID=2952610 RepID=UPI0030E3B234